MSAHATNTIRALVEGWKSAKRDAEVANSRLEFIADMLRREAVAVMEAQGRQGGSPSSVLVEDVRINRRGTIKTGVEHIDEVASAIGLEAAELLFEVKQVLKVKSAPKVLSALKRAGIPTAGLVDETETVKAVKDYWEKRCELDLLPGQLSALEAWERENLIAPQVYHKPANEGSKA